MPNIALFHPQIVHFVVAGAGLGLFFRWVSLTGRLKWTDGAATTLILLGTVAAYFAVRSGTEAHGLAERIPGAAAAVQVHEEEGHDTLNLLLVIAAIEIVALVPALAPWRKALIIASGAVGVAGAYEIYSVGKAGGVLVYSYAGGVGVRSGDSTDVNNLLKAALYDRAMLSRSQKNHDGANAAFQDLATRFPGDAAVQMLAVESLLTDKKDYAGALAAIGRIPVPPDTARTYSRYQIDKADAFAGMGMKDSARAVLTPLAEKFPNNQRIKTKLSDLK
ncbi:MAG TPA: tetratricopeptide repeat protein [Gemmatimonadaceae bacterium]|nr:tetratricopeptide repeat protein [Gemmatimonadaceae bacterium]